MLMFITITVLSIGIQCVSLVTRALERAKCVDACVLTSTITACALVDICGQKQLSI
jgi:hypothetical protein